MIRLQKNSSKISSILIMIKDAISFTENALDNTVNTITVSIDRNDSRMSTKDNNDRNL